MRKIKIYDLEQKKLYIKSAPLRFINNLEGITQYSTENCLYLCGSNKIASNSSETTGSYLFRYDLEDNFKQPSVLVNSAYVHYNPMIVLINDDILVVIGGKEQIFCEKYSISSNNWRKIPILPEERYKGCLLVHQKESNLYLFGGMTDGKFNTSILFTNFRSIGGWDRILLKENDYLLKRNNCIAVIAHPLAIEKYSYKKLLKLNIDGIETFYPYKAKDYKEVLKEAQKRDLLITGGSDFHGKNGSNEIGQEYLREPYSKVLLKKLNKME